MTAIPLPAPDADTQPYWDGVAAGELRIQRCRDCRRYQHFPAPICAACGSFDTSFEPVSGRGAVESFVVVHHATSPAFAARAPYAVAWIELSEQAHLRVLSDIVGCSPDDVHIGLEVELVVDHKGDGPEGISIALPRFRPLRRDPS
ncbi:hypothetical protein HFP15_25155 [Amycolatopsis sp. K13G38]|uniref:Zn-ribbon domain-containing OB-fold protein n=1 Tax=Amycolatopsis acididurans TaxID=2724524 RepID=A0ABX1J8R7_9PSEU|nr:OB-fold domain-containing protein [Amycolatopsis acididurans]NKQ56172.1 hypothetical protein [Amycolatopsis acididurans]